MLKQRTLAGSFSLFGKGLHTGLSLTITFNPAPENHGYKIQRIDLEGEPVIEAIAKRYEELVRDAQTQTVGIAHADCAPDAHILASLLRRSSCPPKQILLVDYEPVTGSHVGPGALALFFLSDDKVRMI